MAIKTKNGYRCFYCNKKYTHPEKADQCREEHQLVYVPISITDINKLMHYIMMPDPDILDGTQVVRMLQVALRKKTLSMAQDRKENVEENH
jgi:primosomal protein N'